MRKMRRPSVAVSFGRGEEAGEEEDWDEVVPGAPSSCAVADFFRGGKKQV
jgi:hypothetical protein